MIVLILSEDIRDIDGAIYVKGVLIDKKIYIR